MQSSSLLLNIEDVFPVFSRFSVGCVNLKVTLGSVIAGVQSSLWAQCTIPMEPQWAQTVRVEVSQRLPVAV